MKAIKKLSALFASATLAISSLFLLGLTGVAHATPVTLYWCNAGSGDFNTASNWYTNTSCSSGGSNATPATGDSLVFSLTSLTSSATVTNDISGLDIADINFTGSNSNGYSYTLDANSGDGISLDDGIQDTSTANFVTYTINIPITLTASQTFSSNNANSSFFTFGAISLGSNNLTVDYGTSVLEGMTFGGALSGSGNLILGPNGIYELQTSSPSFTGSTTINTGTVAQVTDSNLQALGSGAITVNNGGELFIYSTNSTATFPNNLTLAGNNGSDGEGGTIGVLDSCLGFVAPHSGGGYGIGNNGCTASGATTLTLSGALGLTANAVVSNAEPSSGNLATLDFTGNITAGGYTVSPGNSNTAVLPTSLLPVTSSAKAPGTPDTGLAASKTDPIIVIAATGLSALAILVIARKINTAKK